MTSSEYGEVVDRIPDTLLGDRSQIVEGTMIIGTNNGLAS